MKVAVIGAGYHGLKNIYPSLVENNIEISSVTTRHLEKSKNVIKKYNPSGNFYDDVQTMLKHDDSKNIVIVTNPSESFKVCKMCLLDNRSVFVEKPLTLSKSEATEIYSICKAKELNVQVGFMKRFAPIYQRIKEIIDKKELGELRSIQINFNVDARMFCLTHKDFIYNVAIHMLDLIYYFVGNYKVTSLVENRGAYFISFKSKHKVAINLHLENSSAWTSELESTQLTFSGGYLESRNLDHLEIHKSRQANKPWTTISEMNEVFKTTNSPASGSSKDLYLRGFIGELKHFSEANLDYSKDNLEVSKIVEDILSLI